MENNRSFQGVWFPKAIWLSKELNMSEKCLMVEVESLSNTEQGCFASNQHFADFLGMTKESISNIVSRLVKKGFISVTLIYKPGTKQVERRYIKINDKFKLLQAGIVEQHEKIKSSISTHLKMDTSPLDNVDPPHFGVSPSPLENGYPPHSKVEGTNTTTNTITNTKETTTTRKTLNNDSSVRNSSSSPKFSFLENNKYSILHPATLSNIKKLFPDITEEHFNNFFLMAEKEYKAGFANSLDAVLVDSLKNKWNFKFQKIKKEKKDYSSLILNRFNYSLEYASLGYSEVDVINVFKKETAKFKEDNALIIYYEKKIREFFQKKEVSS